MMKIHLLLIALFVLSGPLSAGEVPLDVAQSSLKFTGHAFMHDFQGAAQNYRGRALVDPRSSPVVISARIEIQAAGMTTHETTRDRNMVKWLNTEANPTILFVLKKVRVLQGDASRATKDHPAQFAVQGELTLNRQTRALAAQATGWREGKWLVVSGVTKITTTDYGLPIIKQFFMTVDPGVDITFRLAFDLPPDLQLPARK